MSKKAMETAAQGNKEDRDADAQIRFKSEEIISKDDQIESTKAEMGEVRQENQRLKMHLERITKEYKILETQFQDIMVQQEATTTAAAPIASSYLSSQQDFEERHISLSLGRTSTSNLKKEVTMIKSRSKDDNRDRGLDLGLDSSNKQFEAFKTDHRLSSNEPLTNNTSADNSLEEEKKEDVMGETWPPPKIQKRIIAEDEVDSQHNGGKRARVSVRARCDTPTMNDGCQWRKYGQKIAKGNPCPRAYYRCTVAPSCPVRKQVQRCAEDMSILITTYEGTHNHPLAAAATAMASTTSAAASMLLSGSSSSSRSVGLGQQLSTSTSATTTSAGLHGLTYNNLANGMTSSQPRPHQFYIQNTSQISSSPNTHPTITLDLTTSNPFTSPFSHPHFNRFASSSYDASQLFPSKSTSLNFGSIEPASLSWATNHNNALSYRNMYPQSNNRNNHNLGSLTLASTRQQPQENIYQSFMQKSNQQPLQHNNYQQQLRPDHIAAATKAITADPSFQTALAAALTSIIGGTSGGPSTKVQVSSGLENNLGQKMKWVDQISTQKGNGCGSSYLNTSSAASNNAQSSGLTFLQQPSSAASKSKSTSPSENKQDQNTS
ncbi:hypothetical protein QQ045_022641 [Rhodiola kirilowii]